MANGSRQRWPREKRREQLLSVATDIIRGDGVEALTLGALATRAKVSKPVVYSHFESRADLLKVVITEFDRGYLTQAAESVLSNAEDLESAIAILNEFYIESVEFAGPKMLAFGAIAVATPELSAIWTQIRREVIGRTVDILSRFVDFSYSHQEQVFLGILAASDELARQYLNGELARGKLLEMLNRIHGAFYREFGAAKGR